MFRLTTLAVVSFLLTACSAPESTYERYMRVKFEGSERICPDGQIYVRGCRLRHLTGPFD